MQYSKIILLSAALIASLVMSACGGRTPAPVMTAQYGDQSKSCEALEFEMSQVQADIQRILPSTDKTGKNVALGVAGAFLLVPWFFMDFKNAEQTEYEALRQRYNNLAILAMDKHCGVKPVQYPSAAQIQTEQAKQKATDTGSKMNK